MDRSRYKPGVKVMERPAPVITRPVVESTPDFLTAPPQSFLAAETFLAPASFLAASSFLADPATAPEDFLMSKPGRFLRSRKGARNGREIREVKRRQVILPQFGQRRTQRVPRFVFPYIQVHEIYEQHYGNFTYVPGMGEDFTELALDQANFDLYTRGMAWDHDYDEESLAVCEELIGGWCIKTEHADGEIEHQHPMGAFRIDSRESPIDRIDIDMMIDGAVWHERTMERWPALYEQIVKDRRQIMANPHRIFAAGQPCTDLARNVLACAGYSDPGSRVGGEALGEIILGNIAHDESLWNSLADLTVLEGMHLLDGYDELKQMQADVGAEEGRILHPDELTFLCFSESEVDHLEQTHRGEGRIMLGNFLAIDATYYSLFDPDFDAHRYPWTPGWREVQMVRCK